jgi:hypothetical protein
LQPGIEHRHADDGDHSDEGGVHGAVRPILNG